jgi:hypothetical protein
MFILKYLLVFLLTPVAYPETNSASSCLHKASKQMDHKSAMLFCHNVANDCFKDYIKYHNLQDARAICHNTANHCYTDVKKQTRDIVYARNKCLDVNAPCFSYHRRAKVSIEDAIYKCSY